ncbi:hypothetical protein MKK75_02950 [Methylobacterium sp. J-030]|uniref:hypothetical protein n=1 Tax=Methylobacterium sp. J-030 TaxID=2836627 RepID=UPI001FB93C09|nr:hypothetical protein [Methylobacterium sp. J-030]MCJ2067773.1 hypothetical protein [Methylobacterium sp. J-030]
MSARRRLAWTAALDQARTMRTQRSPIREERLRGKSGCTVGLSCWRGQSGRRYVVAVLTLKQAEGRDAPGAVFLAIRHGELGLARIVGAGHRGTMAEALAFARADRATELHLYRLAETDDERDAIVEDLIGDDAL